MSFWPKKLQKGHFEKKINIFEKFLKCFLRYLFKILQNACLNEIFEKRIDTETLKKKIIAKK